MKKNQNDYDKAMHQLEKLVERIQNGEMGLEEMRNEVKAAMKLIKMCRTKLRNIETDLEETLEEE
ncbi:MAG: exodeoxyribonuclease VII small subunit [Saprospiraceae bacterium]|uniref:Exodeoxyribonuclease VII small subunit n=1 Tax=Candidatus Opimibacter skivensis TaxID=2982028 RepID=A0A9D7SQN8_9BACT|nr:exodeoxyribonuclease VII small subunit [Candidatus Opimibacter skivensis]